ncbi:DNA and RNA helicase [Brevibacillus sp. HD3.3A]|uniref:DNA and RNA helicase n=1 Tax=Brevibacillus sp. HD3.3A TaxID=2738979 RepID=UPI00156AA7A3|nr:DNA and RNA helicase [Brevibacillus sp. HD3.3A]UED67836.1 DNA and RNA helicase [Brevibacillus sp. HD3.3A]
MFSHLSPQFHKGRILKREMLESLRDYPRHLAELHFLAYTDGIISGMDVAVEDGQLVVGRGIIKHQGRIYLLDREERLPYEATGKETMLKIRFDEQATLTDFLAYETHYVLDTNMDIGTDERELGRFKLKEGAKLRSDYPYFLDLTTEYNTWNFTNVEYAGQQYPTLAPAILRYFSHELLKTKTTNAFDLAFATQGINAERVERDLILHYIGTRLGFGYRASSNPQIVSYLGRILEEAKSGDKPRQEWRASGRQRVIVD